MDILEQTSTRLVLRYRPVHIWLQSGLLAVASLFPTPQAGLSEKLLFTAIALTIAIVCLITRGDLVTYRFDRNSGLCSLERSGLRGTRTTRFQARQVSHLTVDERRYYRRRSSFRRRYVYWVYVDLLSGDRLALSSAAFFDSRKAMQAASLVSDFLGLRPYTFNEYPSRSLFFW